MERDNASAGDSASALKLLAAWLLVGIPLAWGVYRTAINASALFK